VLEVDWAGSTLFINDRESGGKLTVYIFVATLPYSQYSYVEGFLDMKSASWLTGHIHAFEYFGGVPESLVPDNLKTGVTKALRGEPILNEAYRELADYYQTVIVPGRVRSPKDYPQTQIILKKATDCSSYREGSVAFEDNNLVQSTKF